MNTAPSDSTAPLFPTLRFDLNKIDELIETITSLPEGEKLFRRLTKEVLICAGDRTTITQKLRQKTKQHEKDPKYSQRKLNILKNLASDIKEGSIRMTQAPNNNAKPLTQWRQFLLKNPILASFTKSESIMESLSIALDANTDMVVIDPGLFNINHSKTCKAIIQTAIQSNITHIEIFSVCANHGQHTDQRNGKKKRSHRTPDEVYDHISNICRETFKKRELKITCKLIPNTPDFHDRFIGFENTKKLQHWLAVTIGVGLIDLKKNKNKRCTSISRIPSEMFKEVYKHFNEMHDKSINQYKDRNKCKDKRDYYHRLFSEFVCPGD